MMWTSDVYVPDQMHAGCNFCEIDICHRLNFLSFNCLILQSIYLHVLNGKHGIRKIC